MALDRGSEAQSHGRAAHLSLKLMELCIQLINVGGTGKDDGEDARNLVQHDGDGDRFCHESGREECASATQECGTFFGS